MSILVERELLIGRQVDGAGRLADDEEISRAHARVTLDQSGACAVEDLGSTNGTFVNGVRISAPRSLAEGDRIELGSTTLLVSELVQPVDEFDSDRTVLERPAMPDLAAFGNAQGPVGMEAHEPAAPESRGFGASELEEPFPSTEPYAPPSGRSAVPAESEEDEFAEQEPYDEPPTPLPHESPFAPLPEESFTPSGTERDPFAPPPVEPFAASGTERDPFAPPPETVPPHEEPAIAPPPPPLAPPPASAAPLNPPLPPFEPSAPPLGDHGDLSPPPAESWGAPQVLGPPPHIEEPAVLSTHEQGPTRPPDEVDEENEAFSAATAAQEDSTEATPQKLSLRLEIDTAGGEALIWLDERSEPLRLAFVDGEWRSAD